jgi:hypothetical protein
VLWCLAEDWPLTAAEEELDAAAIARMQDKWLERNDRDTAGIMGILPLVHNLPMRLRAPKDKEGGAFKNSKCVLVDWELDGAEEARIAALPDNEIMLRCQPGALHLKINGSKKHFVAGLGEGVLRLKPEYKVWSRDSAGNAKVRRKGFEVVPDFGGTAHAYCGDSLDSALGDLLEWDRRPTLEAAQRAYIIKSRVRDTAGLGIVQPYSPALFRQGALPGPALLLRRQRGEISGQELKKAWKQIEKNKLEDDKRKDWPWSMELPCRGCTQKDGAKEISRPLTDFAPRAYSRRQLMEEVYAKGEDLLCFKCLRHICDDHRTKASIPCDGCHELRPRRMFSGEQQQQWSSLQDGFFICSTCSGESSRHKRQDLEILYCTLGLKVDGSSTARSKYPVSLKRVYSRMSGE